VLQQKQQDTTRNKKNEWDSLSITVNKSNRFESNLGKALWEKKQKYNNLNKNLNKTYGNL
jgi:hypothetical protein